MKPILSILTATVPSRFAMFDHLRHKLSLQYYDLRRIHSTLGDIDFRSDDGQSYMDGGLSIGKKRQSLVDQAKGKYLCFLDDDEDIAPNYLETLVRLCQLDKDCCTFKAIAKTDTYWTVIDMSIYHHDTEATPDMEVKRNLWHVCPIRSSIAKKYSFTDINYGEDALWLEKVRRDVNSEAKSNAVLLQYNHSSIKSESDKIIKAGYV